MRVGHCAVIEFNSESDAKEEIKKFARSRSTFFPKAEFVVDIETGPTSCLTLLIYGSPEHLDAEVGLHKEYMDSVRPHVREIFGYSGSLKYLSNRLPVLDEIAAED